MYEAELKFTLSDSDYSRILEILVETWGETSEHVTYRDRYYDLRAGTLADTERELRLRELVRGGSRTWKLTAKAPPFDPRSRSKEEFETSVEDGEVVASILEVVGFSPTISYIKECEKFDLDIHGSRVEIVLVIISELRNRFVELEMPATSKKAARENLTALRALAHDLTVPSSGETSAYYTDLVREARAQRGRAERG